jgi:hypothetical protein
VTDPRDVLEAFLSGAYLVQDAISDADVRAAWDLPSLLEDQKVSGLAGHLARGGVWVVADYLDNAPVDRPVDFQSAGEYFAAFAANASDLDHLAIRDRGAQVASMGYEALVRVLQQRVTELEGRLRSVEPGALVSVFGGKVIRLSDYLETRIVEQTVHLDDLARSVGREPWPMSHKAETTTIRVGIDIASRRSGTRALVRALYRRGEADQVLPVL